MTEYTVWISLIFTVDGFRLMVWSMDDDELQFIAIRPLPEEIEA